MVSKTPLMLIFTDLDGSLLDHHSYSAEAALPLLRELCRMGVPVIPASSKTRAEIEHLRTELGLGGPFIAENGAAVYIPQHYFDTVPADTELRDGYRVREFAPPRRQWLGVLAALEGEFPQEFETFETVGVAGVAAMTGLPPEQAALALAREYSEPVRWLGKPERREQFVDRLHAKGATVQQGGRFMSVSGDCDKGTALAWLREVFGERHAGRELYDLAIGDSANDVAMLRAARDALLIRSPVHDFPELDRNGRTLYSEHCGPAGWSEGVARWLRDCGVGAT